MDKTTCTISSVQTVTPGCLQAAREGCSQAPTLATVFVSGDHAKKDASSTLVDRLREAVPELTCIVGCTVSPTVLALLHELLAGDEGERVQGAGIIGNTPEGPHELEQETGLALSLASLPGTEARCVAVGPDTLPDAGAV